MHILKAGTLSIVLGTPVLLKKMFRWAWKLFMFCFVFCSTKVSQRSTNSGAIRQKKRTKIKNRTTAIYNTSLVYQVLSSSLRYAFI